MVHKTLIVIKFHTQSSMPLTSMSNLVFCKILDNENSHGLIHLRVECGCMDITQVGRCIFMS